MQPFPDLLHTSHPLVERVRWQGCMTNGGCGHHVEYKPTVYPACIKAAPSPALLSVIAEVIFKESWRCSE